MSCSGSALTISAGDCVPSAKVTRIAVALRRTWSAVRIRPCSLMMTPLPSAPSSPVVRVSMNTSEGWIFL